VVVVVEILELHAQRAARDRMLLVAFDIDELAVLDLVDHGARVGTVVWARAEESRALDLLVHVSPPISYPRRSVVLASIISGAAL
jgi:hypothetical protein